MGFHGYLSFFLRGITRSRVSWCGRSLEALCQHAATRRRGTGRVIGIKHPFSTVEGQPHRKILGQPIEKFLGTGMPHLAHVIPTLLKSDTDDHSVTRFFGGLKKGTLGMASPWEATYHQPSVCIAMSCPLLFWLSLLPTYICEYPHQYIHIHQYIQAAQHFADPFNCPKR